MKTCEICKGPLLKRRTDYPTVCSFDCSVDLCSRRDRLRRVADVGNRHASYSEAIAYASTIAVDRTNGMKTRRIALTAIDRLMDVSRRVTSDDVIAFTKESLVTRKKKTYATYKSWRRVVIREMRRAEGDCDCRDDPEGYMRSLEEEGPYALVPSPKDRWRQNESPHEFVKNVI